MEAVSEAAAVWRVLFTPSELYIDQQGEREKYERLIKQKKESGMLDARDAEWVKKMQMRTWITFDSPEVEPALKEVPSMRTMVREINRWCVDMFEGGGAIKLFSNSADSKWRRETYWRHARETLESRFVNVIHSNKSAMVMSDNILLKLDWYLNSGENGDSERLVLPLLTPKLVHLLNELIVLGGLGWTEVSDQQIILVPYNFLRRYG